MWQEFWAFFFWAIGGDQDRPDLSIGHMVVRATIVFILGIIIVRLSKKRFFGTHAALDLLMAIVLGSVVSRAVNGSARFSETIATTLTLVALHWLFATFAWYSERFSTLVKGNAKLLIEDGELQWETMRGSRIGERDLLEALRLQAGVERVAEVKRAYPERSGEISVVLHPKSEENSR